MKRRDFLTASAASAAALVTGPAWADLGDVRLLTAANDDMNRSWLVGLTAEAQEVLRVRIPARGHAAAAHPHRPEAVAFARRPGRFAVVIDCLIGAETARLEAPNGRHFFGHGAFTADGRYLLTTENLYDSGDGLIGVWDADQGYARVAEFSSGGVGPHEILRLPDGDFAIANGGIKTHPDFARAKLNLPTMLPNLSYVSAAGEILEQVEPPLEMHQNSIRHIAVDAVGRIAIALQWQGKRLQNVPLLALHRRGEALRFCDHPETMRLKHYAGSIAFSQDGSEILMTGPKGGHVLGFDAQGEPQGSYALPLASGVALMGADLVVSMRGGLARRKGDGFDKIASDAGVIWDNHLVSV